MRKTKAELQEELNDAYEDINELKKHHKYVSELEKKIQRQIIALHEITKETEDLKRNVREMRKSLDGIGDFTHAQRRGAELFALTFIEDRLFTIWGLTSGLTNEDFPSNEDFPF